MEYSANPYEFETYTKVLYPGLQSDFWGIFWEKYAPTALQTIDDRIVPVFNFKIKIGFLSMIISISTDQLP